MKPVYSIVKSPRITNKINHDRQIKHPLLMFLGIIITLPCLADPGSPTTQLSPTSQQRLTTLVELVGASASVTSHSSRIEGDSFSSVRGVVEVNVAAGDLTIQQNSAAIVESSAYGLALVNATQERRGASASGVTAQPMLSDTAIKDDAFTDALGLVMVNQSSGGENTQVNGAAIALGGLVAIGGVQLNDKALEQSHGTATPVAAEAGEDSVSHIESTTIDPSSFAGARGVFLINQASGKNNYSGNSFTLTTSPQ